MRNDVALKLKEAGVGTSIYYPQPLPRLAYYRNKYGYEVDAFPNAAAVSDCSIALPVGPHLVDGDIEYIAENLKLAIKEVAL